MSSEPPPSGEVASLPERPKENGEGGDAPAAPSKSALKKAQKDKEKAEKAAKRKAEEEQQRQAAEANDVSKEDYGDLPPIGSPDWIPTEEEQVTLGQIASQYKDTSFSEESGGPKVVFQAVMQNAREQSAKLAFLVLGDGDQNIQAVVAASDTLSRQMVKFAKNISQQSFVLVHGLVKKPKEYVKSTTIGYLEIHVTRLFVTARADPLPIQIEDCEGAIPREEGGPVPGTEESATAATEEEGGRPIVTLNTRLNNRVIDLRAKLNHSIFRVKSGVVRLFCEFLWSKGFEQFQTPKLLGAPSEGGAAVFEVTYFNTKAYLAQSPQLHKQMLISAQFKRVFEVCPVFRAEKSNTYRHLTEFTGLDLEMEFEKDYHEVVDVVEELMLHIFRGLRERYAKETELIRKVYNIKEFQLPETGKTPRLTFAEGVKMLREDGVQIEDLEDLSTAQEKHLGALVLAKYNTDFYILDQFPLAVRPFYTMPSRTPNYSNSYDFMMRGQEILSGAQRVHDYKLLRQRMREVDPPLDPENPGLKDYVEAFRHGCRQHAGAGLGLERIVSFWLGLPNVRLASAFPRDPQRLAP